MSERKPWQVCVDTGGTFTDCVAISPSGTKHDAKVLSNAVVPLRVDAWGDIRSARLAKASISDAYLMSSAALTLRAGEDIHRIAAAHWSIDPRSGALEFTESLPGGFNTTSVIYAHPDCSSAILAAHVVTQTPLDEPLPPMTLRLATTRGTNALLTRTIDEAALFVTAGFTDLLAIGTQQRPDLFALEIIKQRPLPIAVLPVHGRLDASGQEIEPIDLEQLRAAAGEARNLGCTTAGVALMHSFMNTSHEQQVKVVLREVGFDTIVCSADIAPMIGYLARSETTSVEAALARIMRQYVGEIRSAVPGSSLRVMTSTGGLTDDRAFKAVDGLLSGPVGGVSGAVAMGNTLGWNHIIGFDMGGTSTDVSRAQDGPEYRFSHRVGDATLLRPALAIETVAAGGGSICGYADERLFVGPESAGAEPGPACYGRGGPLTITDVNLLAGRIDPSKFAIPITKDDARAKLEAICTEVNADAPDRISADELIDGWLDIANQRMASAIEQISIRRGFDVSDAAMVAFGGAGGQHACAIAQRLGVSTVLCPQHASLLSAVGLQASRVERFAERQVLRRLDDTTFDLTELIHKVESEARNALRHEKIPDDAMIIDRRMAELRLVGQESCLTLDFDSPGQLAELFHDAYVNRYGYTPPTGSSVEVVSLRIMASTVPSDTHAIEHPAKTHTLRTQQHQRCRMSGRWMDVPIVSRLTGTIGSMLEGPALISEDNSVIVVEGGWRACWWDDGHIVIEQQSQADQPQKMTTRPEAVEVELFTHHLTSIASEMGEVLQRTAMSTNVKERLDFSCAILDPNGELLVNAPHIPVHLGSMGICVRAVRDAIDMQPGDVFVTNHPAFGGSHLPDITVVTPIYTGDADNAMLIGYAANRAHHAEIGGTRPGSMPPTATRLIEEGVVIAPMHIVRRGEDCMNAVERLLRDSPYPSRNVEENIADLRAQVAANHRAMLSLQEAAMRYGNDRLRSLGQLVGERAEKIARESLVRLVPRKCDASEQLDDGAQIRVVIEPTPEDVDAALHIDFTGTANQHPGNFNATRAITTSAVLYVLRVLVGERLPLTEAIMRPIDLVIPDSLLSPAFTDDPSTCPAVVGGNVETSQRVVDTLLKALGIVACGQGTMNNVLFGNDSFGYYETICGGAGAGPDFDGASMVHTHMTNTRITDPEVLEHRYPVRLHRFEQRQHSGGPGKRTGGDGATRELEFLEAVSLSILSQHRRVQPFGVNGGEPGSVGEQYILRTDGSRAALSGLDGFECSKGDRFILHTPGGGGYGKSADEN